MANHPADLVCRSPLRWAFAFQRPHRTPKLPIEEIAAATRGR